MRCLCSRRVPAPCHRVITPSLRLCPLVRQAPLLPLSYLVITHPTLYARRVSSGARLRRSPSVPPLRVTPRELTGRRSAAALALLFGREQGQTRAIDSACGEPSGVPSTTARRAFGNFVGLVITLLERSVGGHQIADPCLPALGRSPRSVVSDTCRSGWPGSLGSPLVRMCWPCAAAGLCHTCTRLSRCSSCTTRSTG